MQRLFPAAIVGAILATASTIGAFAAVSDDKAFIANVVSINMEEIQIGQLAQQKSQSAAVKAYGQKLVADHTAANMQATAIATKLGAVVPKDLSADSKKMVDALTALSGPAFDSMFLTGMIMGHQKAIQMFTDQQASTNSDVATFAKNTLPALQTHLMMAQMLQTAKP
jgi:putative membrane protein